MVGCGGQGVFGVLHSPQASRGLLTQQQYREEMAVSQLICPQGFIYNKIPEVQKEVNLKNPELANPEVRFEFNRVCL